MRDEERRKKAKARVKAKLRFYIHLAVYLIVGTGLIINNLTTSAEYLWSVWPILGWGIGVGFHGLAVFVFSDSSGVTERMIKKELENDPSRAH